MPDQERRRRRLRQRPRAGPPAADGPDRSAVTGAIHDTQPGAEARPRPDPDAVRRPDPEARPRPYLDAVRRPDPDAGPGTGPDFRSGLDVGQRPSGAGQDDRETERGLRGLVGSGASQVGTGAALRARDAARPTAADLAEAEERLVVVHRNWSPRDEGGRGR